MTCQHCQTWILDEEHRCYRCGRRVRNVPQRISAHSFPIAAAATALDYSSDFDAISTNDHAEPQAIADAKGIEQQGLLFRNVPSEGRVIPFDSLTTRTERQLIRARAAGLERPAPVKTEKVEIKRARTAKSGRGHQQSLEFYGFDERHAQPKSEIICDAPVAPGALRLQAALVDLFLMVIPVVIGVAVFSYAGGEFSSDKHSLPWFLAALSTIPLLYKLLWTIAGRDTAGMRSAGLVLVDFDGNPPSQVRRWLRCGGACLSFLAAGIGVVWSLVDEDRLTWHDHISSTFPTVREKEA